ncbi:MAG: TlpA disulfide reductase family protein [Candidatus Cybelea sp.]|jgi:thiol-disulfide isomerase/thioredoxin
MNRRALAAITTVVAAAIVVVAVVAYFKGPTHGSVQTASQSPIVGKAQVGKTAPQFEVATTAGYFDLSKTRKPVFLEVFATWCPHCQRETAIIDRLYAKYRNRVDFVAVSGSDTAMDGTSASSELDVLDWIRQFHVQYPVAYDPILNVANLYMQGGFPTIAIIGTNKKIRYLDDGEIAYGELDSALRSVLR